MKFNVDKVNDGLLSFLDRSPNAFFAVRNMCRMLEEAGFAQLPEGERWDLAPGGSYYVTRNGSALIAFRMPGAANSGEHAGFAGSAAPGAANSGEHAGFAESAAPGAAASGPANALDFAGFAPLRAGRAFAGFQIMASHCDSPVFKVKPGAEMVVENAYVKLNVEKYGGMLLAPWTDRPLSVAGRVAVKTEDGIETRLVDVDRDLLIIPNLAIHMDREANEGHKWNVQVDLLPLLGEVAGEKRDAANAFSGLIADAAGISPDQILDMDIYLYSRTRATRLGMAGEFIAGGRLDDLQCAYASLLGILEARPLRSVALHCVFDNEEVGSGSKQGAAGTFLRDVLRRISLAAGMDEEGYQCALASSFMVSADNAHALHPNHPEKADACNRPRMNHGIVIKYSANQKYTTDAVSAALFRALCETGGIPCQTFANRSDMVGGSTLGNISQGQVSLNTVDVGLPQLAMHSPCETAGARDTAWLAEAARILFSTTIESRGDGSYRLHMDHGSLRGH